MTRLSVTTHHPALTAADVSLIYTSLLGRPAGVDEIKAQLEATSSWQALLAAVASSPECEARLMKGETQVSNSIAVNYWHPDLTDFTHQPGTLSPDGEVVVGLEGQLFLIGGTNAVFSQYQPEFAMTSTWREDWSYSHQRRRQESGRLGVQLVELVVPDKLTVLSHLLPPEWAVRSSPPAERLPASILYPVEALRAGPAHAFLRTDTHLSPSGNEILSRLVLTELGVKRGDAEMTRPVEYLHAGDLGVRFMPGIVERTRVVGDLGGAVIVEDNTDEMRAIGRHIGTRRVFKNAQADDSRVVVVFGDSFSVGAPHYQGLSWALAQHFATVHFIWSPYGWDATYLVEAGAAIAVCEMAERFVPRPPDLAPPNALS